MLDNSQTTVKLTDEQTLQLETYQTKLANLEGEISIATKNLKALKSDTEHAIKEKVYQEGQLATLTSQVDDKQKELENLQTNLLDVSYKLDDKNKELKDKTETNSLKEKELTDRESKVISEEQKLAEHIKVVEQLTSERLADENIFNSKVAKLKEVISTF